MARADGFVSLAQTAGHTRYKLCYGGEEYDCFAWARSYAELRHYASCRSNLTDIGIAAVYKADEQWWNEGDIIVELPEGVTDEQLQTT